MSILPSTTRPRYGPPPHIGTSIEGGGFVVTCACRWLKWFESASDARAGRGAHAKKCKAFGDVAA